MLITIYLRKICKFSKKLLSQKNIQAYNIKLNIKVQIFAIEKKLNYFITESLIYCKQNRYTSVYIFKKMIK